jgi:hypothetical protein
MSDLASLLLPCPFCGTAIPLYASPQPEAYGVRVVSEEMVQVACGRYMITINSQPEDCRDGAAAMRAALEAALSHTEQEETTP